MLKNCFVCFQKPAFVRAVHSQTTCFPGLSQLTFTVGFLPTRTVKYRERFHSGEDAMSIFCEAVQPPVVVSCFQSETPLEALEKTKFPAPPNTGVLEHLLEIFSKNKIARPVT